MSSSQPDPHARLRALIVDDDASVLLTISLIVRQAGLDVTEASNSADAKTLLDDSANQPYDLLLTDVMLTGMDGYELALYARTTNPRTVVIFMTGGGLSRDLDEQLLGLSSFRYEKGQSAQNLVQLIAEAFLLRTATSGQEVLIVDYDWMSHVAAVKALGSIGLQTSSMYSENALDTLQEDDKRFAAMVIAVRLWDSMSAGIELAEEIRRRGHKLPILFVCHSAEDMPDGKLATLWPASVIVKTKAPLFMAFIAAHMAMLLSIALAP